MGFKYKKENNRRFLMEKTEIAVARDLFLRKYEQNLLSPIPKT